MQYKDTGSSHQKFIEKHDLKFSLIVDTSTDLLQNIGTWGEKTMCGKKASQ